MIDIEPIRLYQNSNNNSEISEIIETCSICLEKLNLNPVHELPECKHKFHSSCLITWLRINKGCPMCRGVSKPQKFYKKTIFQHIINYCKSKKNTSKKLKSLYLRYIKLRNDHKLKKNNKKQFKKRHKNILKKNYKMGIELWKAQSKLYNIKKEISSLQIQVINIK